MSRIKEFEQAAFRAANGLVGPAARAGLLAWPACAPGVISLETTGRRSGRTHRVPVLAAPVGECVVVMTARGARSDWFGNIEANPNVRYWRGGEEREAQAVILGTPLPEIDVPEVTVAIASAIALNAQLLGWRAALLIPH